MENKSGLRGTVGSAIEPPTPKLPRIVLEGIADALICATGVDGRPFRPFLVAYLSCEAKVFRNRLLQLSGTEDRMI